MHPRYTNPGRFGPGLFRPGSFRPIFGVGCFGLRRWVISALGRFRCESFRPNFNRDRVGIGVDGVVC